MKIIGFGDLVAIRVVLSDRNRFMGLYGIPPEGGTWTYRFEDDKAESFDSEEEARRFIGSK